MKPTAFAVVVLVACWTNPARADTTPMFDNLPATYTPGTPFSFDLRLPALTDFTDYTLNLVISTDVINPNISASATPGASYPFTTTLGFQTATGLVLDSNQITFTISDSTAPGVTVTPGSNDALAHVTVAPGADLTGPIQLSVRGDSVFHYNTELISYELPTGIPPITSVDTGPPPTAVPAPGGALVLGFGALILGLRARRGA